MDPQAPILFTAFEPSGDDHAAAVIAELRARHPSLPIFAWGGPRMQAAGATIVERTGDDAVMGVPGLQKVLDHRRINERIAAWMQRHRPSVHIPVDSPGANFPVAKIAKAQGIKVVHLVAPQIWAWGRWRIGKLRRRTDLVLCLLPFEEPFFRKRHVPARFIGHPLFDAPPSEADLDARAVKYDGGSPRIAMMPGSRPKELKYSLPLVLDAFRLLKRAYPGAAGVIAATTPAVAQAIRDRAERLGGWPEGLRIEPRDADGIIRWCDIALVKSGTITLQITRQRKPMVVFYKGSRLMYYSLVKWLLATKYFTLPNVLAHREIVPEFVPYFGGPEPIVAAARRLLDDPAAAQAQRDELERVISMFRGRHAAAGAADGIEELAGLREGKPATEASAGSRTGLG